GDFIGDIFISRVRLYAFLLSVLVAALLFLFLNRSRTGRAIRAASENWEAAIYMGIDIDRTNRIAFGVGVALTAVGGSALVTFQSITPFVGFRFVVVMFAAVVLGGLGSVSGAFVGGVLIGIIQSVSQVWTSAAVKNVWVFALFLLILYVRPNGLFGKVQRAI
ncbi:MAG: branched-chain amino acid ABC transporter permease, partial [Acidimicrobiaceae bacterium]|nr:branched-chain amino acid ABC transporter permease [Acidimicrobiaceae bacterium]